MLPVIVMLSIYSISAGVATAKPKKTEGVPFVSSPGIKGTTNPKVDCYYDANRNWQYNTNEYIQTVRRSVCDARPYPWLEL